MGEGRRRAIAVGFSRGLRCCAAMLEEMGVEMAGCAGDGAAGLRLARETTADLVVCDAVLAGMDGAAFIQRLRKARLDAQPMAALLRPRGLRIPGEDALGRLGATALDSPPERECLEALVEGLAEWSLPLPEALGARLTALMDALGVPRHIGRDCLERAVALAWADRRRLRRMKEGIYPPLARQTGLSPAQIERAMRHAIDVAWRAGEIEQQHKIFGDTLDARRGKPTCGEMIAQLAEELRWEGRL